MIMGAKSIERREEEKKKIDTRSPNKGDFEKMKLGDMFHLGGAFLYVRPCSRLSLDHKCILKKLVRGGRRSLSIMPVLIATNGLRMASLAEKYSIHRSFLKLEMSIPLSNKVSKLG